MPAGLRLPGAGGGRESPRTRSDAGASVRFFVVFLGTLFGCELVIMLALEALLPRDTSPLVGSLADASLLTVILAPLLWSLFVRPAQHLTESRRLMLERVLTAQEEERRRIAADLHDGLGQSLTSVLIRLAAIEQEQVGRGVHAAIGVTREIVSHALDDIRRIVRDTRPPVLDDLGLAAAAEKLVDDIASAAGLVHRFSSQVGDGERLDPASATAVFRIIQEALTNAVRHARCRQVDLSLAVEHDEIVATIGDDGCGFDVGATLQAERRPFGLLSMRERVESLGGDITIASRPGHGTVVSVRVPLPNSGAIR